MTHACPLRRQKHKIAVSIHRVILRHLHRCIQCLLIFQNLLNFRRDWNFSFSSCRLGLGSILHSLSADPSILNLMIDLNIPCPFLLHNILPCQSDSLRQSHPAGKEELYKRKILWAPVCHSREKLFLFFVGQGILLLLFLCIVLHTAFGYIIVNQTILHCHIQCRMNHLM